MTKFVIKTELLAGTAMGALVAFCAPHAFAQTAPAGDQVTTVEEVVVTSQRREERLQNVPIQVTAFTSQKISDAGIKTTEDAISHIANITFDHGDTYHGTFITLRGMTEINNADPPIAMVVDGVPLTNQKQLNMNLFDVERIEVLKGPQGALYGRNAVGGAINIVTKAPSNEFEGFGDVSYGNGNYFDGSAGISGPLVKDKLLFRVSGNYKSDDGRIDNTFRNDKVDFIGHDYSIRARLLAMPTDRLTLDARAEYNDFRAGSNYYSAVFSGNPNDFVDPQFNVPGFTYGRSTDLTLKADYKLDFGTLTSITAYNSLGEIDRADLDFRNPVDSPGGFYGTGLKLGQGQDQFIDMTSQEIRLVSNSDQRFRWLAGGYYLHTKRDLRTRGFIDFTGDPNQIDTGILLANQNESNSNNAYAAFAQLDFDITDQLTLTGGLRYDRDERQQTNLVSGQVRSKDFSWTQPKVTLTYKPDEDRLLYATYGTGFRSGGFNAPNVSITVFDPEHLQNFEVGFKSAFFGRRLILNGAAYLSKINNYQFFFVDALSASQIIANIDKVTIKGVELEAQAVLAPGLEATAAIGTTNTSIDRSSLFPGAVGNKTPRTVPISISSSLQYRHQVSGDIDGMARVDWQHYGKKYWGVDNADVQDPYDIVNLRVGLERGGAGIYLWAKNIGNANY
jgi:iron complex outermembrane receptor protein